MNGKTSQGHTWAIVLAAGSGTRLSSLTRDASGSTPHRLAQTLAQRVKAAANSAAATDVPGGGINLSEALQRTHASALHRQRSAVVTSPRGRPLHN